ncbi:TraI/MobA(P) family conjugative relaxase [Xanthomonas perforans]|uniref:TraI/MobA(P) family conjugative relaxase n=1 Tax=Xanthomonas perforans TaxID=442694 RepID=UPI00235997F6|nr:TraI/MobA(P) family conjugative relaxase [Xanthomonas perforans]MDC9654362.1 relaxase/mobilization nuclease domain-containing protein [Xanthomonas perforans]
MIAKRIPSDKATSNAARLVRYVVDAQGLENPRSWTRTADYILDTGHDGHKVGGVKVTNCMSDDPAAATLEILATQALNTRSKADKNYHMVFSFPPGESPSLETLHAIEQALVDAIGLGAHQRISAVHKDTDHLHVHVAINKVHPTTYNNIEPFYDKRRLMEACDRLEVQYGLQRTNHGRTRVNTREQNKLKADIHERYNGINVKRPERQHLAALREPDFARDQQRSAAIGTHNLRDLSGRDLAGGQRLSEMLVPFNARHLLDDREPNGLRQVRRAGDSGSRTAGESASGSNGGVSIPVQASGAATMEAHTGQLSFAGWLQKELAQELTQATSWEQMHARLGRDGLSIKLRGAGLVIVDETSGVAVKASTVDRNLSISRLTASLGPYAPPAYGRPNSATAGNNLPRPKQQHVDSSALFAQYQDYRNKRVVQKRDAIARLREAQYKVGLTDKASFKAKRALLKGMRGARLSKALAYHALAKQQKTLIAERRIANQKQITEVTAMWSTPTWQQWLQQQAATGHTTAQDVLRSRENRNAQLATDLLTAGRAAEASAVVFTHLKPRVQRDGSTHYRTADGGLVIDRREQVHAQEATVGAAFVALSLAGARFPGQALIVEGTKEFKAHVATLAGQHGLDVAFSDVELEKVRKSALRLKNEAQENSQTAVTKWVEGRNALRSKISDIDYTRPWEPSDAGQAEYRGRRKMEDGSEVLLLRKGGEILVKPSTPAVVAKASRIKIGQAVTLDARGRITDTSRGR